MPTGRDRSLTGDQARHLPDPGTAAQTDAIASAGVPGVGGVPSPVPAVDNTPTASGQTPRNARAAAQSGAEAVVNESSTDSQADSPELREGPAPHYFVERIHQAFFHDVIIYVEGEDVSPFLVGSVQVSYGFGTDPNSCSFTLDNAGHRFTLTPENLKGEFRRTSPDEPFGPIDYDETAKSNMFARKGSSVINPIDPDSGGRRFPLHLWGPIFHKNDAVKVWIHNPVTERDEWIPAFTGFIDSKPTTEDYIKGLNKISVSCKDIRALMNRMRVNKNTMLTTLQATGSGADPTNQHTLTNANVFRTRDSATVTAQFSDSSNRSFSRGFFEDVVRGSNFENPWTSLTLPNLIAALTFLPKGASEAIIDTTDTAVAQTNNAHDRQVLTAAAREIQPLQTKVTASGFDSLTDEEKTSYNRILAVLRNSSAAVGDIGEILTGKYFEEHSQGTENSTATTHATHPGTTDIPDQSVGMSHGSGRLGRMRPGVFPWRGRLFGDPPRPWRRETVFPSTSTTSHHNTDYYSEVASHMERWYNLCFFSTPLRADPSLLSLDYVPFSSDSNATAVAASDSPQDFSSANRRYWTADEVRAAGMRTTREGAWHPSAQAVHFLSPGRSTPTEMLWAQKTIARTATSTNPNWSTRLKIISEACDTADYRFWVSGAGDLIFEFAQYDFAPKDYGAWESVLTLDHHLKSETLDDEGGEIKTGVSVTGSLTRFSDFNDSGIVTMNPITTIGVWSPNLASRLGVNIGVRSYPQISDKNRLEQVAALVFQKALATADKYSITLAFRPWVLMNRPIFNNYRARYALVDGISWTYPVTAGSIAGHTSPTMKLALNYTRSLDEVGVPRYITGGPANAMYFARPANEHASGQYLTATTARLRTFASALRSISTSGEITQQQRDTLRTQYRAIVPQGQNSYNVISSLLLTAGNVPPGEEDPRITALHGIESDINELTQHAGSFTEQEYQTRLQELTAKTEELVRSLEEDSPNGSYEDQTSAGVRPLFGVSGIRSTLRRGNSPSSSGSSSSSGNPDCNPGDPDLFSSPVGPALTTKLYRPPSTAAATSIADVAAGAAPPSTNITEFKGDFPRYAQATYGLRRNQWHRGVDIYTVPGADVYCVADGVVLSVKDQFAPTPSSGQFAGQHNLDPQPAIYIIHKNGYVTVYRHLAKGSVTVTPGSRIRRNTIIGKVGLSGAERGNRPTHLHFETCVLQGSPTFNLYVVDEVLSSSEPTASPGGSSVPVQFTTINAATIRALHTRDRKQVEALSIGENTAGTTVTPMDRGSLRVMYRANVGVGSLRDTTAEGLGLEFLRSSSGTYRSQGDILLTYSPLPNQFPFSRAYNARAPYTITGRDKTSKIMSLRDYFDTYQLKGIPLVNLFAQTSVPDEVPLPTVVSTGSARAIRAAERRRNHIIARNERNQAKREAAATAIAAERALFSDSIPPNDCPPGSGSGSSSNIDECV